MTSVQRERGQGRRRERREDGLVPLSPHFHPPLCPPFFFSFHRPREGGRAEIYAPIQLAAILWRSAASWPLSLPLSYGGRARGEGRLHLIMSKAPPLCGGRKAILLLWLPSIRKHFWQICWGWRSRPKRISKSKIYLLVN